MTKETYTVVHEGTVKKNLNEPPTTERPSPPRSQIAAPTSVIATEWCPTSKLRWNIEGRLQQEWRRDTTVYRTYNGNPTPRACKGIETHWRDVPTEQPVNL